MIDSGPDSLTYNTVVETYSQVIDTHAATPETDGLPVGKLRFNVAVSPDGSVASAAAISIV